MRWGLALAAIPPALESSPPPYTASRARRQEVPRKIWSALGGVLSYGKVPNDSVPLLAQVVQHGFKAGYQISAFPKRSLAMERVRANIHGSRKLYPLWAAGTAPRRQP